MNTNNPRNKQKLPEMHARKSPSGTIYRPSFAEVVRGFSNKSNTNSPIVSTREAMVIPPKSKENSSVSTSVSAMSSRVVMQHGWTAVSSPSAFQSNLDDSQVTGTDIWGDPSAVGREKILRWRNGKRNQKQYNKEHYNYNELMNVLNFDETAEHSLEHRNTSSTNTAIAELSDAVGTLTIGSQKDDIKRHFIQLAEEEARLAATQQFRFAVQAGLLPQSIFDDRLPMDILLLVNELFKLQQNLQSSLNYISTHTQMSPNEEAFMQNAVEELKRQLYQMHLTVLHAYMQFKGTVDYQPQQSSPTSSASVYSGMEALAGKNSATRSHSNSFNTQVSQAYGSSTKPLYFCPYQYSKSSPVANAAANDMRWSNAVITSQSTDLTNNEFIDPNNTFRPIHPPNIPQPYESMGYCLHGVFDEERILATSQSGFDASGQMELKSIIPTDTPAHFTTTQFQTFPDYKSGYSNISGNVYLQGTPVNSNLESMGNSVYNMSYNESTYGNYPPASGSFGSFRDNYMN